MIQEERTKLDIGQEKIEQTVEKIEQDQGVQEIIEKATEEHQELVEIGKAVDKSFRKYRTYEKNLNLKKNLMSY